MVAETAWLDGHIVWQDDHIAWRTERRVVSPSHADLAVAQRRLYQIRRYPVAARIVLGDATSWLARRQVRLDLAKRLHRLSEPDLPALAIRAALTDAGAIRRLATLLPAEASCLNALPAPISATLVACGQPAAAELSMLVDDDTTPESARVLAALALGALQRVLDVSDAAAPPRVQRTPWLRRAYMWGVRSGLPSQPPLVAMLLARDDGAAYVARILAALQPGSTFALPVELLRELLDRDVSPERVAALAESAANMDGVARRVARYRDELPNRSARQRRTAAERLNEERRQALAVLADLAHGYAQATTDPATIDRIARLAHALLDLDIDRQATLAFLSAGLARGQSLPPDLSAAYLRILTERFDAIWGIRDDGRDTDGHVSSSWLRQRHDTRVEPLCRLLAACDDPKTVGDAVRFGMHSQLAAYAWRDQDRYRLAVELAGDLDLRCGAFDTRYLSWLLCRLLDSFPSEQAARAALQPLRRAVQPLAARERRHMFEVVISELPGTRRERLDALAQITPYLGQFIAYFTSRHGDMCWCHPLVGAALHLHRAVPEQATAWLDWLLTDVAPRLQTDWQHDSDRSLRLGVSLGTTLSDGEFARFTPIVETALRYRFAQRLDVLEEGIRSLARYPALRRPLAQLLPQQPRRCGGLIVRLGLAGRLGADVFGPLAPLEEDVRAAGPGEVLLHDWEHLLEKAPELAPTVAEYVHAQHLQGQTPRIPPGVRRALEQPATLARELEHLERRVNDEPTRIDLVARVANLGARLADADRVQADALAEAHERLAQVAAEAQLAAAERLVLDCYRARLARVAGPLPPGLEMNDDLLNAALLSVDIRSNRNLLRRLLRARLAGDQAWPIRHPANARFLAGLAASGVAVAAWLSAHPRAYRDGALAGGRVHLRLEGDPLRILQMGNDFDTCLSFGAVNAFSTVANACELNKRVIYATDSQGVVVGRKLIGIDTEGGLVGFYTYTSLGDDAENAALRAIFRHYAVGFAARCGLALHDAGTVPRLFAEDWYDDGVVPWHEVESSTVENPGSVNAVNSGRDANTTRSA
jgi:hypothetical protein